MSDIEIHIQDSVWLNIEASNSIHREIYEHFSFEAPGRNYMPAYRKGNWDGMIHLYNIRSKKLPAGLHFSLIKFASDRGYTFKCDNTISLTTETDSSAKEFFKSLKPKGGDIEPRESQLKGFSYAIRAKRGIILSPTGSGKSLIIWAMVRYHLSKGRKILVIVPTTNLVQQLRSDFIEYNDHNRIDDKIHTICGGSPKTSNKPIIISTWQSIFKEPKKYFEKFDVVIGDEVHLFDAKSLKGIMQKLINAEYRVGLSATLKDAKSHELSLIGLFGPIQQIAKTYEMINDGDLAQLTINCLILEHEKQQRMTYHEEMDYLVSHDTRNRFILNIANSCSGNTLVLFQFVDKHGKILYNSYKDKYKRKECYFVSGKTKTAEREMIRSILENNTDIVVFASYGVYSTGVNIKNLDNIIFASPSKSKIRVLQSIGRQLRISNSSDIATLYDISDNIPTKSKKLNYTQLHFIERVKLYAKEKYRYFLYNLKL